MKEINIARAIINKRREKGLTQDELANYIGVSKASVSKWETGQSYPDITFLPQLATFFNITLDELMDYKPQMSKDDIRKLYLTLSSDFSSKPFDEVLEHCRKIVKKYYSCFPLLFQIGSLLVNNSMESGSIDKALAVITEAKELFIRVKNESKDAELCRLALNMEAFCALTLGNAEEVIDLLGKTSDKIISSETLLAPAYQMIGNKKQAMSVLQVGIYQHMGAIFSELTDYLQLCIDTPEQYDETYKRANDIIKTFDLKNLHPAILVKFYIVSAQGYIMYNNTDKALEILEECTDLVTGDIYPLKLKADSFFNLLDEWINELDLGAALPRDEKNMYQSIIDGIANNQAFSPLAKEHRFQKVIERLNNKSFGGSV